jgi:hypothetical protein
MKPSDKLKDVTLLLNNILELIQELIIMMIGLIGFYLAEFA